MATGLVHVVHLSYTITYKTFVAWNILILFQNFQKETNKLGSNSQMQLHNLFQAKFWKSGVT